MKTILTLIRNIFGKGIPAILTLVLTPVYLQHFGLDKYSLFVLIVFLSNLINVFDFGLKSGLQQTAKNYSEDVKSNIFGYAIIYCLIIVTLLITAMVFQGRILRLSSFTSIQLDTFQYFLFSLVILLRLPLGALQSILSATYKVKALNLLLVTESLAKHIFLLVMIALKCVNVEIIIWSNLIGIVSVFTVVFFLYLIRLSSWAKISFEGVRENLTYSRDIYIGYLTGFLTSQGDRILVLGLLSSSELSFYGLLTTAASLLHVPGSAMLVSVEQELFERKERLSEQIIWLKWFLKRASIALLGILFIAVLGYDFFFKVWIGKSTSYLDYSPFVFMVVGYCVYYISAPMTTLFNVIKRPKFLRNFNLVSGPIFLLVNYYLVKNYGVVGACFSIVSNFVILFQTLTYLLCKELNISSWFWRNLALPIYISVIAITFYLFV